MLSSSLESISDLSSLTKAQVDTLKIHLAVSKGVITMENALRMRRNTGISRGTHYRVLAQARKNLTESLFTVATAVQLGLVKPEEVEKLISAVSLIPADVDQEKLPEVMALVRLLASRIVML